MHKKLYLFNSYSKTKEEFIPIDSQNVKMYVCGPTLYAPPHIGNARPLIVFDVLFRVLQSLYENVIYVRNITDVDDKIIKASNELGITCDEVVEKNNIIFKDLLQNLNIQEPTFQPFATQYIDKMLNMIQGLVDKGYAYEKDGNVFFNTTKFKEYGELSKKKLEELKEGYDEITHGLKDNSADFALWKKAKNNEPYWDSNFGRGRPGWHIECSAMSHTLLGEQFDIHGGGIDLLFPHHENERAQSMAFCQKSFMAKYWVHNGFINVDNEKMSKSIGNIIGIHQILDKYHPNVLRLCFLFTHYRHPINFKEDVLIQANNVWDKINNVLNKYNYEANNNSINNNFTDAILDDLNTPLAIQELQKDVSLLQNGNLTKEQSIKTYSQVINALNILGLNYNKDDKSTESEISQELKDLITERDTAKLNKDYKKADEIRDYLLKQGVILEDTKNGTVWRIKK